MQVHAAVPTAGIAMPNFERSSLNRKLTIISLLSTATALLFVFGAFAVTSIHNHRKDEAVQLAAFARIIGAASAGDLLLVDRRQAGATLSVLDAQRSISAAVLYDRFGQPVATYRTPARQDADLSPMDGIDSATLEQVNRAGRALLGRHMRVVQAVQHGELVVGAVMIEADLLPMWLDIAASLGVIGLAMGAALLVSLGLAGRLKHSIAEPITKLIQAAQKVSASQNYGLRVPHQRSDELGVLSTASTACWRRSKNAALPCCTTATNSNARSACAPNNSRRPRTPPKRPAAPRAVSWPR